MKKKRKVIVEGIQILDDGFRLDKKFFKDKPLIILRTDSLTSIRRAFERDGRGELLKGLKNLDSAEEYLKWYAMMSKSMDQLAKETNSVKAKRLVDEFLKKYEEGW